MKLARGCWLLLAAGAIAGCGRETVEVRLPAPEVFTWGDQPISFSPPGPGWRREKEQSGGLRGARFVKERSVGKRIHVAEHHSIGDRDRCARIRVLLERGRTNKLHSSESVM